MQTAATWSVFAFSGWIFLLAIATSCTSPPVVQPYQYIPEAETSPWTRAVMSDDPVAYWRLGRDGDELAPGPSDDRDASHGNDGAPPLAEGESVVLAGMNAFDKYAFTVELWVRAPQGRFLSYTSEAQPEAFVLAYDAAAESLVVTVLGERVETGVELPDEWRLLSVSWDGADGETVVTVHGRRVWSGELAADEVLLEGGQLTAGPIAWTTGHDQHRAALDGVVWYDERLHPSRTLSHLRISEGGLAAADSAERNPETPELAPGHGHIERVRAVAFSPDGRVLASGASDDTIKLWDVQRRRVLRTLRGHTDDVYSVAFSPDGRVLASGSDDESIKLWNVESGEELQTLSGHRGEVRTLAFSPDGRTLASGSEWAHGNNIKLWDVESGREIETLRGHQSKVRALAFSPDGHTLVTGSARLESDNVRLWSVSDGGELAVLSACRNGVRALAFSPEGRTFASGCWGGAISLWDVDSGRVVQEFHGRHEGLTSSSSARTATLSPRAVATSARRAP